MNKYGRGLDKHSRIFVAGHKGLVGSALVRKLRNLGYRNLLVKTRGELDLRKEQAVHDFFVQERPEYVFLAAAKVGGILANNTFKAEFIYDNIMIAANVIQASYRHDVKKLLNLGSSCIYPKFAPQPMKEEYLLTGKLEETNEPYAIAKISALKLCRYYNEQYGTNFMSVMPTNLYGPGDNFNLETSHVLPALVRKFHLARMLQEERFEEILSDFKKRSIGFGITVKNSPSKTEVIDLLKKLGVSSESVHLWGSGEPSREFLYIDDLADACFHLISTYNFRDIGEFVNVGMGEDLKIKELARMIKDIVGFNGEMQFDHTKYDGTPRKLLDISRVQSLGWFPKTSLREGIQRTYDWYRGDED